MISEAVRVHGLDWFLHLDISDGGAQGMVLRVGFKQIPSAPVTCATHIRYILDSMDPNGARLSFTRGTVAVCDLKSHRPYVYVPSDLIEQLLNDGWFTVFAKLHIFKPVQFSPIPSHFAYSFSVRSDCVYPVAERNGFIYVLTWHSGLPESEENTMSLAPVGVSESDQDSSYHTGVVHTPPSESAMSISEQFPQWDVQCMRAFDKESTVTLATISANLVSYVGSSIDMETKQIAVTQVHEDDHRIQLDLVGLGGGVQTRSYQMIQNNMGQNSACKAVKTSKGWIMADRMAFEGDEAGVKEVRFRFWLLADELTLLSQLTRSYNTKFSVLQSISYNALYCAYVSPTFVWHILVYDLQDHPSVWKEYQICPGPVGDVVMLHVWPEPVLAAWVSTNDDGKRVFLFRLEFRATDCLLIPFLALPPQRLATNFGHWSVCFNPESVLFLEELFGNEVMLLRLRVPRLKTLALLQVQRLLGELRRMDDQGQPIWIRWKHKLDRLIGTNMISSYL